ncbi:LAQU0S04e09054g1_1 [Lachancea quebecensis]|uniref:LAQU0S04e09054g1_1 n=1 Tax=Lachancea quebecensis TaxID=1654605 RepID=A0A0P1KSX9_9SACH|nr:LAQU0S04e09054g1_1 [Lachancea quebecensis]
MSGDTKPVVTRRTRSNSSSDGSASPMTQEFMTPSTAPRNRYTHIIILKSLNNTFETKFLVVPFKPDGLKLGRPIANSGVQPGGKQDLQSQVRPDNGHFDSRVLSRNHASLSCEPFSGKIYIRDLKSSNGTFVNGNRITQSDTELKVGDIIDLGTDIDAKFEHRKISALVEDISVIPLINEEEPFANGTKKHSRDDLTGGLVTPNAQRAAFEAAMFGDVNNLDLEESLLGSETEILSGIFINNSIGTSPNLINVIKTLVTEISLERHEFEKMKSIERFLIHYTTNLEHINKLRVENNDLQLVQLQNSLKQKLNEKHDVAMQAHIDRLKKVEEENESLRNDLEKQSMAEANELKSLRREIEDLNTRLEVEKFKNAQLNKKADENSIHSKRLRDSALNKPQDSPEKKPAGRKSTILLSAFTVGVAAAAFQYASKR